jgi:hypothetical protein
MIPSYDLVLHVRGGGPAGARSNGSALSRLGSSPPQSRWAPRRSAGQRAGVWGGSAGSVIAQHRQHRVPPPDIKPPAGSDWAVTRWLITQQPIRECVRLEAAERRP